MLVLSRHAKESIVIGDGPGRIVVTVAQIGYDRVRLGITADRSIPIHRAEILGPDGTLPPRELEDGP